MIQLQDDALIFTFPDLQEQLRGRVHAWVDERFEKASTGERTVLPKSREEIYPKFDRWLPRIRARVAFQRTLRIPDDGRDYPLPPGFGCFPVFHVDDYAGIPAPWKKHGGVMLPMHRAEAMWLQFSGDYPFALKIAAGGVCAVSGERWSAGLRCKPQNYVVLPEQPWLDGFRVDDDTIRQFVAAPLGKGLTVEQQVTGEESWGGLQLQVYPIEVERFWEQLREQSLIFEWRELTRPPRCGSVPYILRDVVACCGAGDLEEAGLGAGGRMKQKIATDPHGVPAWDTSTTSRCYVHLCLAEDWHRLTGAQPPHLPPSAAAYAKAGLPWFDYEDGKPAVTGESMLSTIKSVSTLVDEKTGLGLPGNESVSIDQVIQLVRRSSEVVREF
jgi:hypothetical protein